jgi:hypothetical protein
MQVAVWPRRKLVPYQPAIQHRSREQAANGNEGYVGGAVGSAVPERLSVALQILVETAHEALPAAIVRQPAGAVDSVQAHRSRETPMFAADMERKALKGIYAR